MQQLYPLKFYPIYKEKLWGGTRFEDILKRKDVEFEKCGESWEISAVQGDLSTVSNGYLKGNTLEELIEIYMDELVGEKTYDKFGVEFPLLFKFLDSNQVLSVQVHPDDEHAKKHHKAYGKTEMWYVVEAEPEAEVITGFSQDSSKEEFIQKVEQNRITDLLNVEKSPQGSVFYIPAGRIHTLGKGLLIAEIQQTSDITYRIYDWNRADSKGNRRELHIDLAKDVIDYKAHNDYKTDYTLEKDKSVELANSPYFTTNIIELTSKVDKDYNMVDSFVVFMCVEGEADIAYYGGEPTRIKMGETVLIPASLKNISLIPTQKSKLLEVYIK